MLSFIETISQKMGYGYIALPVKVTNWHYIYGGLIIV